jgi:hypothetical protein
MQLLFRYFFPFKREEQIKMLHICHIIQTLQNINQDIIIIIKPIFFFFFLSDFICYRLPII